MKLRTQTRVWLDLSMADMAYCLLNPQAVIELAHAFIRHRPNTRVILMSPSGEVLKELTGGQRDTPIKRRVYNIDAVDRSDDEPTLGEVLCLALTADSAWSDEDVARQRFVSVQTEVG